MKILLILIFLTLPAVSAFSQTNFTESNAGTSNNLQGVSIFKSANSQCLFICGTGSTLKKSTDLGQTWIDIRGNLPVTNFHVVKSDDCSLIVVFYTLSGVPFGAGSINGGQSWITAPISWATFIDKQKEYKPIDLGNSPVALGDTSFVYGNPLNGRWGLAITTNNGQTFDTTGLYLQQNGSETGWLNCMDIRGRYVWFGANNPAGIYRGYQLRNWQRLATPGLNSVYAICFKDTLAGMIGGDNGILYTTNKGNSWAQLSIGGSGNVKGIVNDRGQNWWAARGGNIWFSSNNGTTWSNLYTAPAGNYNYITTDSTRRYIIGIRDNGGVSVGVVTVGIHQISNEVPGDFKLEQNFPNPFNPETVIKFQVSHYKFVTLTIYDILGKEIETLVNEELKPGSYEAEWNPVNFPSGTYFYKLTAGDFTETKKMLLIK